MARQEEKPLPLPLEHIPVGRGVIHFSHKVFTYKHIFYCIKCGKFVHTKMRDLCFPCAPRIQAGQVFLNKVNAGTICTQYLYSKLSGQELPVLSQIQNQINRMEEDLHQDVPDVDQDPISDMDIASSDAMSISSSHRDLHIASSDAVSKSDCSSD